MDADQVFVVTVASGAGRPPPTRCELDALHEDYIERVNGAIDQDREDLAWARADD